MESLVQDLRYALRMFTRNPGFFATAVIVLMLGIGANTAIFSVVNAVVFKPLPFAASDRLVTIWGNNLKKVGTKYPSSPPDVKDWQSQNTVFDGIVAYAFNQFEISGKEGADHARGIFALPNLTSVLGIELEVGHSFNAESEHRSEVLLSRKLWMKRYNGDANIIGAAITLNSEPYTIIGVMPPQFRFPSPEIEMWCSAGPLYATTANSTVGNWVTSRSLHGYCVVARLKSVCGSRSEPRAAMSQRW